MYRRNRQRWVRLAYAVSWDQRQAEDAVAEAVARVWPRFRDGRVDDLPAGQRAVIALRFLEDLSEADTAATLDVSVGTVKSRLHLGMHALRQGMEEVGADG